ncbi:hypothetical protein [Intestinimonas butyriciproducens]|uniref:Uncharacterized protein n=1 Tax=Intestinimonas butyriciproducens TaxID=1297617 RepID=A0A0S2W1D8_9FIRM|nr:hypothetical protein [Intestinimonas butyriciproducens]ALP93171.1 hypothetical protein IB211_00777c [Intestinimonas butyriciproducens]
MKNARKIAALALSLSMLAALAGCGDDTANAPSGSTPPASTPPVVSTPAPTPTPEVTPEPTEVAPEEVSPYAGEYDIALTNPEGDIIYLQEFIVNDDGTLVGVGDASGMSNFEGVVNEDGTFTGEFTRLGGALQGTIDADGNVTGTGEIRGRNYTFEGPKL